MIVVIGIDRLGRNAAEVRTTIRELGEGIKRHFPNLTQIQVNAVIGFAVADFCAQNAGKLGS